MTVRQLWLTLWKLDEKIRYAAEKREYTDSYQPRQLVWRGLAFVGDEYSQHYVKDHKQKIDDVVFLTYGCDRQEDKSHLKQYKYDDRRITA